MQIQNAEKHKLRQEHKLSEPDAQTTGYEDLHIKLKKLIRIKYQVPWLQWQTPFRCFRLCQSVWNQTNQTLSLIPYFKILFQHLSQGQTKEHHGVPQPQYMVFNTEPPDIYMRRVYSPVYSVCDVCVCVLWHVMFMYVCVVYVHVW